MDDSARKFKLKLNVFGDIIDIIKIFRNYY